MDKANKPILCPTHNIEMKKVKIVWGLVNVPVEEEVIYGGCCVDTEVNGRPLYEYGYIYPECEKLFSEDEDYNFEYVVKDSKVVPFEEATL